MYKVVAVPSSQLVFAGRGCQSEECILAVMAHLINYMNHGLLREYSNFSKFIVLRQTIKLSKAHHPQRKLMAKEKTSSSELMGFFFSL